MYIYVTRRNKSYRYSLPAGRGIYDFWKYPTHIYTQYIRVFSQNVDQNTEWKKIALVKLRFTKIQVYKIVPCIICHDGFRWIHDSILHGIHETWFYTGILSRVSRYICCVGGFSSQPSLLKRVGAHPWKAWKCLEESRCMHRRSDTRIASAPGARVEGGSHGRYFTGLQYWWTAYMRDWLYYQ